MQTSRRSFFQLITGAFASIGLVKATPTTKNVFTIHFVNVHGRPSIVMPIIMDTFPNGIRQRETVTFVAEEMGSYWLKLFRGEEDLGLFQMFVPGKDGMPEAKGKAVWLQGGETMHVNNLELSLGHQTVPFLKQQARITFDHNLLMALA